MTKLWVRKPDNQGWISGEEKTDSGDHPDYPRGTRDYLSMGRVARV
jgi:hypothetical protein